MSIDEDDEKSTLQKVEWSEEDQAKNRAEYDEKVKYYKGWLKTILQRCNYKSVMPGTGSAAELVECVDTLSGALLDWCDAD
jgi:hypothetical protein